MRKKQYMAAFFMTMGIFCMGCAGTSTGEVDSTETKEEYHFSIKASDELYFTCQNWDIDAYGGESVRFSILSLQPIDVEQIQIQVPIENPYQVEINEQDVESFRQTHYWVNKDQPLGSVIFVQGTFPYELYQCYRNTDWEKLRQLYVDADGLTQKVDQLELSALLSGTKAELETDEDYMDMKNKIEAYENYRDLYVQDYEALTPEDLPIFYAYDVYLYLGISEIRYDENGYSASLIPADPFIEESFNTITIQIGEDSYEQNIGEVRMHPFSDYPFYTEEENKHIKEEGMYYYQGLDTMPWGDGMFELLSNEFTAQTDLTLTGMYLKESDIEMITAHVTTSEYSKTYNESDNSFMQHYGNEMDFYWDMKSPLEIEKGTHVQIKLILKDEDMTALEYNKNVMPVVQYSVGGTAYELGRTISLNRDISFRDGYWMRYAVIFDDLEEQVKSYCDLYCRPLEEEWRDDL